MKTGFIAVRLAVAGFMIPYLFALDPGLLFIDSTIGHTLLLIVTALAGVLALGAAAGGYLLDHTLIHERILLVLSAFSLLTPGLLTDGAGIAVLILVLLLQRKRVVSNMKVKPA